MIFVPKLLAVLCVFEVVCVCGFADKSLDESGYINAIVSGVLENFSNTKTADLEDFNVTSASNITYNASFQQGYLILPHSLSSVKYDVSGNETQGFNISTLISIADFNASYDCTLKTENRTYTDPIDISIQDMLVNAVFEMSSEIKNYSLAALDVTTSGLVGSMDIWYSFKGNFSTSIIEDLSDHLIEYSTKKLTEVLALQIKGSVNNTLQHIHIQDFMSVNNTNL